MALADRQHGAVAHRQLLAAGLTRREIQNLGWLRRVHRGVYVVGAGPISRETRWMAAILACGDDACLCARSAAAALGLAPDDPHAVQVAVRRRTRCRPGIRTHQLHLAPHEHGFVGRIACTEPNRTIADLAAGATTRELERAMDEAAYRQRLDVAKLRAYATRPGRGRRLLRQVLEQHDPGTTRTQSELEEVLLRLVDAHGLPRPQFNVPHTLPGGRSIRIDALYAEHGLALELDGRDADLQAVAGYRGRVAVSLRLVTPDNVRAICELRLAADQRHLVAPAAFTVAEAHYEPDSLLRAIYLDEEPVGVLLVLVEHDPPHLVRFMVDEAHQRRRVGTAALELLADQLRADGWAALETSYHPGEDGPSGFWLRCGFRDTGRTRDGEPVASLPLTPR